jgi:hypothetical protein
MQQVEKVLSRNDVGATGGHQAGIAVPRQPELLEFFPRLDAAHTNPRVNIEFRDLSTGSIVTFSYIYYNGKLLGTSTRNEYRLTGMSKYLRLRGAEPGDSIVFTRDGNGYSIDFRSASDSLVDSPVSEDHSIINLSGKWLRKN